MRDGWGRWRGGVGRWVVESVTSGATLGSLRRMTRLERRGEGWEGGNDKRKLDEFS